MVVRNADGSVYLLPEELHSQELSTPNNLNAASFIEIVKGFEMPNVNILKSWNLSLNSSQESFEYWIVIATVLLISLLFVNRVLFKPKAKAKSQLHSDLVISSISKSEVISKRKSAEAFIKSDSLKEDITNKKPQKPFVKALINEFKDTQVDTDKTISHFIAAGGVVIDALFRSFELIKREGTKGVVKQPSSIEGKSIPIISTSSEKVTSTNKVIEITDVNKKVTSNIDILKKKERARLYRLTNSQLREKLEGVDRISRLRKAELIDLIISMKYQNFKLAA